VSIIVVYGPPGTRTDLKEKLRSHFKLQHVIDGWDGKDLKALRSNSLVLCEGVAIENHYSAKITKMMDISYARYLLAREAGKGTRGHIKKRVKRTHTVQV